MSSDLPARRSSSDSETWWRIRWSELVPGIRVPDASRWEPVDWRRVNPRQRDSGADRADRDVAREIAWQPLGPTLDEDSDVVDPRWPTMPRMSDAGAATFRGL